MFLVKIIPYSRLKREKHTLFQTKTARKPYPKVRHIPPPPPRLSFWPCSPEVKWHSLQRKLFVNASLIWDSPKISVTVQNRASSYFPRSSKRSNKVARNGRRFYCCSKLRSGAWDCKLGGWGLHRWQQDGVCWSRITLIQSFWGLLQTLWIYEHISVVEKKHNWQNPAHHDKVCLYGNYLNPGVS